MTVAYSFAGVENRYDRIVQEKEALVRFALPLLLVHGVLRHRYPRAA